MMDNNKTGSSGSNEGVPTTSCGVVHDLLPLYVDSVCSVNSGELVKDHMTKCERCRAEYDAMRSGVKKTMEVSQSDLRMISAINRIKRRLFRRQVIAIVCTAILVVVAINIVMRQVVVIPYEEGMLTSAVLDGNHIVLYANKMLNSSQFFYREIEEDGESYTAVFFHNIESIGDRFQKYRYGVVLFDIGTIGQPPEGSEISSVSEKDWVDNYGTTPQDILSYYNYGATTIGASNVGAIYYYNASYNGANERNMDKIMEKSVLLWKRGESDKVAGSAGMSEGEEP